MHKLIKHFVPCKNDGIICTYDALAVAVLQQQQKFAKTDADLSKSQTFLALLITGIRFLHYLYTKTCEQ